MSQPATDRALHAMSPNLSADDRSLLDFAVALKSRLRGPMRAALPKAYAESAAPAYAREHGSLPSDWRQVGDAMAGEPIYRWWSALARAQQEYYVDLTARAVDSQLPDLVERYRCIAAGPVRGSLTLDPSVAIPDYQSAVDIHCVPGSYFIERCADDVWAGARSDLGSFIFTMGRHGGLNEDKGVAGARFVQQRFPDLEVRDILDMGCTVGLSTLPWADAFPQARLEAIDLSAPSLRYAHARAESLGKAVHFRQANAEHTPYPDESFDLVVSHILLHETSRDALWRIVAECHRLLRPGGVMLHVEVPVRRTDPFDQFLANWDGPNNNEPFWPTLSEMDLVAPAVAAGFPADAVFETVVPTAFAKAGDWLGYGARKAGARGIGARGAGTQGHSA